MRFRYPRIFAKGAHFYPITLGHEFSGRVVTCGDRVTDLQQHDAVACVPLLPCFNCPECQRHYYSLCKHYQFVGSRSHGGNAEFIVVKRANLVKLPANVSLLQGRLLSPSPSACMPFSWLGLPRQRGDHHWCRHHRPTGDPMCPRDGRTQRHGDRYQ